VFSPDPSVAPKNWKDADLVNRGVGQPAPITPEFVFDRTAKTKISAGFHAARPDRNPILADCQKKEMRGW